MSVLSWQAYKKKNVLHRSRDVSVTLKAHGWHIWLFEYDYGLFKKEKPYNMAIRRIIETAEKDKIDDYDYLYVPRYTNYGLYMQTLTVYRRLRI